MSAAIRALVPLAFNIKIRLFKTGQRPQSLRVNDLLLKNWSRVHLKFVNETGVPAD